MKVESPPDTADPCGEGRTRNLRRLRRESLDARIRWRNFHAALALDMRDAGHARDGCECGFIGAAGDDRDLVQDARNLETRGAERSSGLRYLVGFRAAH